MQIEDRTFLITGAAKGLGSAVADALQVAKANVVRADIIPPTHENTERMRGIQIDVTSESDAKQAIDYAVSHFGELHGLINCAGIAPGEKILNRKGVVHAQATFDRTLAINLSGTFNMMRLATEAMAKNKPSLDGERGVIINTASIAGYEGQVGQCAYAASKAGVIGLTLPAARELACLGIRVMCIAPGIFETDMVTSFPQEVQDSLAASIPFPPRLGRPTEFAEMVKSILTNVMLNGATIRLDGAIRMQA